LKAAGEARTARKKARDFKVKLAQAIRPDFWRREHHLDKMTFKELVVAYFQYPAIIAYLALSAASIFLFIRYPAPLAPTLIAVAVATAIYPFVWYVLHRWVLHSRWMFKVPPLAATWKRIHYDHHQDPNHLEVLFGALHTTLPTIALATVPIGWAIGSVAAPIVGRVVCSAPNSTSRWFGSWW
jgi:hypothetical protein